MSLTPEQRSFFKQLHDVEDGHEAGQLITKQALDATVQLIHRYSGVDFAPTVKGPIPEAWVWLFDGHVPELEFVKTTPCREWRKADGDASEMWRRSVLYATALEFVAGLDEFGPMLDSVVLLDDGTTCIVITGGYTISGNTFVVCVTDGFSPFLAYDLSVGHTVVRLVGGAPNEK